MAKKQTRRSISVSRSTYERLKAYCETNQISMSQFIEERVGDFLGRARRNRAIPAPPPLTSTRPELHDLSDLGDVELEVRERAMGTSADHIFTF